MKKEKAIEAIKEMPHEFDLEELMERLVFINKVDKGLRQLEEGKTLTHDEVKESLQGTPRSTSVIYP